MTTVQLLVERLNERRAELAAKRDELNFEIGLLDEMLSGQQAIRVLDEVRLQCEEDEEVEQPEGARQMAEVQLADLRAACSFLDLRNMAVWKAAVTILEAMDRPIPVDLLANAIQIGGKDFGGENAAKSLASHICQKPSHIRTKAGWAYLPEWGEPVE